MKKTMTMLGVIAFALVLNACNGSGKTEDKKATDTTTTSAAAKPASGSKLEGSWVVVKEGDETSGDNPNLGTVYEFAGDILTLEKDGFRNPGATEVTDKTFSFLMQGATTKVMYNYSFEGDTLVVSMQDGPQVFRLVKK